MSKLVLGLHGFSSHSARLLHDTGVSLVDQAGQIIGAVNEERLSRIKNDGHFPYLAYEALLSEYNVSPKDIDAVAFPDKKPLWQTMQTIRFLVKTYKETNLFLWKYLYASLKRAIHIKRIPVKGLIHKPTYYIEHHLCHAASAYYTAPWDDVTIVTLDGMGDYCIGGTINIGAQGKIHTLYKTNGFYSPGLFYMFITGLLGFKAGRHEGKIVGLAALGDSRKCYSQMKPLLSYCKKKHDFFSKHIPFILKHARYSVDGNIQSDYICLHALFKNFSKEDIAAAAQCVLEEAVIDYIKDAVRLTGKRKLVLAGGVFANVKLNHALLNLPTIENIYIHPNMGDGGLSTGAALYVSHYLKQKKTKQPSKPVPMKTVYLGMSFSNRQIEGLLRLHPVSFKKVEHIQENIAGGLAKGLIVGNFQGRMEYGPRALGNRSILAPATDHSINVTLNNRLNRTEFMPFAPAILAEQAKLYFPKWKSDHVAANFMTITYDVCPALREKVPAIVHVDGTARPQVVYKNDNPMFYKTIQAYYEMTGIPMLINTSFNKHEEPIVCKPEEAIDVLISGCIDALAIGNFWVMRKSCEQ